MSVQGGIWNFDDRPVDAELVHRFSASCAQHGPDGESAHIDGQLAMLYRPFHTTPESSREHQPLVSQTGISLTWDGRLDNADDLSRELRTLLPLRPTEPEIVLAAYQHWGPESFDRFVGDWALALWDGNKQNLFLAKDYIGTRHLYYYVQPRQVIWFSLLSPLVRVSRARFRISDEYVAGYLAWHPDPHLTPYCEIHGVPAGHFVSIRRTEVTLRRYWNPLQKEIRYNRDEEYEEHFRHLLRQSVARRLRSSSPILAELSGGVDSSSLVCIADDLLTSGSADAPRLDTLTFYDESEYGGDERHFSSLIEQKRGRSGHHVNRRDCLGASTLRYQEFSAVPIWLIDGAGLEKALSTLQQAYGYRVVLSGVGGDEFLGGVSDATPQLADLFFELRLRELNRQTIQWSLVTKEPWIQILARTVVSLSPKPIRVRWAKAGRTALWIQPRFAKQFRIGERQLGALDAPESHLPSRRDFGRSFAAMRRQFAYAPPWNKVAEDRRYPYLDRNLFEFLQAIPATQLLRPGERRWLMRRALAGIVPAEVLNRRGKGHAVQGYLTAIRNHSQEIEVLFANSLASQFGYIDDAELLRSFRAAQSGVAPELVRILNCLSLELWLRDLVRRDIITGPAPRAEALSPERRTVACSAGSDFLEHR